MQFCKQTIVYILLTEKLSRNYYTTFLQLLQVWRTFDALRATFQYNIAALYACSRELEFLEIKISFFFCPGLKSGG